MRTVLGSFLITALAWVPPPSAGAATDPLSAVAGGAGVILAQLSLLKDILATTEEM